MHAVFTMLAGILCLLVVLLDAFQTIILPRRATGRLRLTRIFYVLTWIPWGFVAVRIHHPRKRETALSFYGPLSLIFLLVVWACGMVFGFSLIYYALGSPFTDTFAPIGYLTDLYVSGTNFFTLGLGDVTPHSTGRATSSSTFEAGTGFGFLAIVMGYFPGSIRRILATRSQHLASRCPRRFATNRRRTHAPPLLTTEQQNALAALLSEWERWSAELLESHISYHAALLFPLAAHQPELDRRAHLHPRYLRASYRRRSRT